MKVVKILNNNALLATDDMGIEYVYLGKGLGFQNKMNQELSSVEGQKQYQLLNQEAKHHENQKEIIEQIDALYLEISSEILVFVQEKFSNVDEKILLPLADHIAFAIQRIKKNIEITNPFTNDIKLLFPEEYSIAEKGRKIIADKIGILVNDDEVSYITLHIHSAISAEHIDLSMQIIHMIQNFVGEIEKECGSKLSYEGITYTRFVTHIKFMVARIYHEEHLGVDMNEYTKNNFPYSYGKAVELTKSMNEIMKTEIKEIEIGYLALHIERVVQSMIEGE